MYKKKPNLHKKIEEFINWKKDPKKLPNNNVEEEWFIARDNILEVSRYFFSRFLKKKIDNDEDLARAVLSMGERFYTPYLRIILNSKLFGLGLFHKLFLPGVSFSLNKKYNQRLNEMKISKRVSSMGKSPDLFIFSSLIYFISSIEKENRINKEKLNKGARILKRVYPVKGKNWEELSVDYANSYIAFFMQKL